MSAPPPIPAAPSQAKVLRKLFLTLFLRGRSARGLQKSGAPKSILRKLLLVCFFYFLMGAMTLGFLRQPVFVLSVYLHSMTLVFLGMFVAASTGEVLFNKEEGDILMHRPIDAKILLWAKINVILRVSLIIGVAFNLVGLFIGLGTTDGNWLFPVVHLFSMALEALFCVSAVIVVYQLCLRWFGRERLDGLMTTSQVFMTILMVMGSQIIPRMLGRYGNRIAGFAEIKWVHWLPPAWFAGLDDAIAGSGETISWITAGVAITVTALLAWLAFDKLAKNYEIGLHTLNEARPMRPSRPGRRKFLDLLVNAPPLKWWLRDSVTRASFRLTLAYLLRDRDIKLRVYPGLAPMLVVPAIFLFEDHDKGGFSIAFSAFYLGIIPLLAMSMLKYSQQWQAADIFRSAPIAGPGPLCHGARKAVLFFLTAPLLILLATLSWFIARQNSHLPLLLPGIIVVPLYALIPCIGGNAVPLSLPTEEVKSASRGFSMIFVMAISGGLAGLALYSWSHGWFRWMLLGEASVATLAFCIISLTIRSARWSSAE